MELINLPNIISVSRLPLAVLTVYFLGTVWSYVFFALIMFSDFLDGFLARRYKMVSTAGALIDNLFDRAAVMIVFITLFVINELPYYFLVVFFLKDFFNLLASLYLIFGKLTKIVPIKSRLAGKISINLQFLLMIFLLINKIEWAYYTLWPLLVISIIAIGDYVSNYYHQTSLSFKK